MAQKIVLVDTSLLIDLFRRKDKKNAFLVSLVEQGYTYCISAVTNYEIYRGASLGQETFWSTLLGKIIVLPFDESASRTAAAIAAALKRKNKQIAAPDLFIAATAISNNLPLATLNKKHFEQIEELQLVK